MSSTTTLPTSSLLGDLSGTSYTTTVGYDAIGQATSTGLQAMGGLPAETVTTGYRLSGAAQKLTLTSGGVSTPLVTGVTYSGSGQMLSRSYGNGVTRGYTWDTATRALTGLTASFVTSESGSPQTVKVQDDAFTRDVMGRVVTSTSAVPVIDGTTVTTAVTAERFSYDGFNRLGAAWTVAGSGAATCGSAAPANATATGWDGSATAYAAKWSYSAGGKISSLVKGAGASAVTSTYHYDDAAHPAAVTSVADGTSTDGFTYDAAGRMVSRTVDGVTTALTWDVTSSLTETVRPAAQGGHVVYAYDASGQRVAQATLARPGAGAGEADLPGTATAYVASGEVVDPNTAATSTGDLTATRYYTFGGSTVAIRTNDGQLSLMLGDEQGSTNVMMPVRFKAGGALEAATLADASEATRTSYTPFGELRGTTDNTATDRGWLGQVEDRVVTAGNGADATSTGTGLTYLNARYYDPTTMRFISPDPLMNPGDPKTLDPYRYADNNPVVFTDATGLASCYGLSPENEKTCIEAYDRGSGYTPQAPGVYTPAPPPASSTPAPASGGKKSESPSVVNYMWHGVVNAWGGMLNGATSTVNGLYAKGFGVQVYESVTGNEVPWIPEIPSVGIWGDYDTYKGWSWYGSTVFFVASVVATKGASGAGVAVEEAGVATEAVIAADSATAGRGLNQLGGIISQEGTNAAGGRIFTSTGTITQNDFAGFVNNGLMRGEDVHILTGAHGTPTGSLLPDARLFADDVGRFGEFPGVTVHDLPSMTPEAVSEVLRGPGTIIGGFCNSAVCLAPFN